jgi:hypothetical protein
LLSHAELAADQRLGKSRLVRGVGDDPVAIRPAMFQPTLEWWYCLPGADRSGCQAASRITQIELTLMAGLPWRRVTSAVQYARSFGSLTFPRARSNAVRELNIPS